LQLPWHRMLGTVGSQADCKEANYENGEFYDYPEHPAAWRY